LLGTGVVDPNVIAATLLAAIAWTFICTVKGLPISVSHALIGALAGSALMKGGVGALAWKTLGWVAVFIVLSPIIGLVCAAILMVAMMWICRNRTPRQVNRVFRGLQLLSAAVYSLSHGLNDAQKTMGIIWALLLSVPALQHYAVRNGATNELAWWIIITCNAAIALGTYSGGWKVVRTLGNKVTRLTPVDGFAAEGGGGATILVMSILGIPVSTTHTITGAIFGVGMTRGLGTVRWSVGMEIVTAWILTLPCSAATAALVYLVVAWVAGLVGG
jgi:PiT family inorganic phosphate transporter